MIYTKFKIFFVSEKYYYTYNVKNRQIFTVIETDDCVNIIYEILFLCKDFVANVTISTNG